VTPPPTPPQMEVHHLERGGRATSPQIGEHYLEGNFWKEVVMDEERYEADDDDGAGVVLLVMAGALVFVLVCILFIFGM
jgi:hypothetical protein